MNVVIRQIKQSDVPNIVELETSLLGETIGETMLLSELHNSYAHFLVAEVDNKPVGYIGAWILDTSCDIINFVISESYQNQGIGTNLMNELIKLAHLLHATEMILEVKENNNNAIHLYDKWGFKKIHERKKYYHDGQNAIVMRKELI